MVEKELKFFGLWDAENVVIRDDGLRKYINIEPKVVPRSSGRYKGVQKPKTSIIERLIRKLMVPGHRGSKHVLTSGRAGGQYNKNYKTLKEVFKRIESQTKQNPLEVFVRAIENSAMREEIAAYQVGGIIVRRAVVTSPQRRVDLALRIISQSAYRKSFGKKETIVQALSNELMAAANNDASKSEAIKEKERVERESEGAR